MNDYVYLVLKKLEVFDFNPNYLIKFAMARQHQSGGDKARWRVY